MDPNIALATLRAVVETADEFGDLEYKRETLENAVTAFASLDEWLTRGGFLPDAWNR